MYIKNKSKALTLILTMLFFEKPFSQPCSSVQNLSSSQKSVLTHLKSQLDSEYVQENFNAIDSLNSEIIKTYGLEAGLPDATESYYNLAESVDGLTGTNFLTLSRQLVSKDSAVYANLWKIAKGMGPPAYQPHSIFLRLSAEMAAALLKIAEHETDSSRKILYRDWATRALDSLATMQLSNGAFPFPDLRPYNNPVFSPIIQNFIKSVGSDSNNVLVNGWIIDDKNRGEFKFDAGTIANAYFAAYQTTGKMEYKNLAISIAKYLLPLKINSNYNYNTFVSIGLTRAYQLTNESQYLNRALINLRYGLFPGQISDGRWVDGHNANSRYHSLIIQNIIPTINIIPVDNPFRNTLVGMTNNAIQNLLQYSNQCGSATGFQWLISAYSLDSTLYSAEQRRQTRNLLNRHINQAVLNGKYLDLQSLSLYLEVSNLVSSIRPLSYPIDFKSSVFPNPFSRKTNILIEVKKSSKINLSLFDQSGKLCLIIDTGYKNAGTYRYTLSGDHLARGTYFLIFRSGSKKMWHKIILSPNM